MNWMFKECSSLTSVNLNNLDTSQVTDMGCMFCYCTSLNSLNLSTFDTSKVQEMSQMFKGCEKLEYINLKNFNEIRLNSYNNIFDNIPDNVVVCVNENNIQNKILPQLKEKICYTNYCSENWKSKQKKIINPDIDGCKCEFKNCLSCLNSDSTKKKCTNCNDNFYKIEDDPIKFGNYFYCYKEPIGYYLDSYDSLYKKCYHTCNTCKKNGDDIFHNCLTCNSEFQFEIKIDNFSNCYKKCDYYYYFDDEKNNSKCPKDYPSLLEEKLECIKFDIKNSMLIDLINNKNETGEIEYYDKILDYIETAFTSEYYDTMNLDNEEDEISYLLKFFLNMKQYPIFQNYNNNNIKFHYYHIK